MSQEAQTGSVAIPSVRLDDVVGADPVGLLKIDVEGHELLVLQGAAETLKRWRPVVYVENDRIERPRP